jgi:hypothetical protein
MNRKMCIDYGMCLNNFGSSSGSYSHIHNDAVTAISGPAFTCAFWMKRAVQDTRADLFDLSFSGSTSKFAITWMVTTNVLRVGGRGKTADGFQSVSTVMSFKKDVWYHIVATMDVEHDAIRIWVNGVEVATTGTPSFPDAFITVGSGVESNMCASIGHGNIYNGFLKDVFFVNRVLSQDDIDAVYYRRDLPLDLFMYLPFDGDQLDYSGNSYDASAHNQIYSIDSPADRPYRTMRASTGDNFLKFVEVSRKSNLLVSQGLCADTDTGAWMCPLLGTDGKVIFSSGDNCLMYWQKGATEIRCAGLNAKTGVLSGDAAVTCNADLVTDADQFSPHLIIKLAANMFVMFYTAFMTDTSRKLRAAKATTAYTGEFTRSAGFEVASESLWEGSLTGGGRLEIDPGVRVISEDATYLNLYILYTAQEGSSSNIQGWVSVQITKATGEVALVERYAGNPLTALKIPGDTHFRDGGSLPYDINGKYFMWGCTRDSKCLTYRSSSDPMFNTCDEEYNQIGGTPSSASAIEKVYFFPLPTSPDIWAMYHQLDNEGVGKGWMANVVFMKAIYQ